MRLLATFLVLLAAIHLHLGGVQADTKDDNDTFYYNNGDLPNIEAYAKLLEDLRSRLASGTDANGIAVTRPPTNVPLQERFVQVQLQNSGCEVITVIIDTVNVYVLGYLENRNGSTLSPTLHYLNLDDDIPTREALFQAFPNPQYVQSPLGFAGNYGSLPNRETHELGHDALNDAIRNLYFGKSQSNAMLVIIQMVSEAVRIRYIEHLIRRNMLGENLNFIPDPRAISMENKWSDLSEQIQWSGVSGVFNTTILVRSVSNEVIPITSVVGAIRQAALALMLYRCNPNAIRMPVPVAVRDDGQCPPYGEPTTNIIGRDGQCVDVKNNQYNNGNSIILWVCINAQRNQLWTFKSDGTIRSNGKCLTTSGNNIIIFDCDTAVPEATQWFLYNAGTIMNPKSGLVISAATSTQGTLLTVAKDSNSSTQAWSAGNYTQPTINYISGFREMCLQANSTSTNTRVWLENCVIGTEPRQQWALYGDSTIRLFSDRTLCMTSNGHHSLDRIILVKCQGQGNQRWTFMADGTILNPNAGLVMDVRDSDVSLQEIILHQPTGNPNQKWLAF
ncbi:hypothetical protein SSX86_031903 [Deinandra increscens subsp. villosa]|uniref:Ribosome-inactivating protein n=1 Tax=Deinandra increscens subsp. villosa TaxID=3103831 RepID=A0AAP0C887_9ASTR